MEDKKAIDILLKMLDERSLSADEKEAISAAIGVLSWTSLAESGIRNKKAHKDRDIEHQ